MSVSRIGPSSAYAALYEQRMLREVRAGSPDCNSATARIGRKPLVASCSEAGSGTVAGRYYTTCPLKHGLRVGRHNRVLMGSRAYGGAVCRGESAAFFALGSRAEDRFRQSRERSRQTPRDQAVSALSRGLFPNLPTVSVYNCMPGDSDALVEHRRMSLAWPARNFLQKIRVLLRGNLFRMRCYIARQPGFLSRRAARTGRLAPRAAASERERPRRLIVAQ